MTMEKLWESACCGENDKLKEYYENGGKINRRYRAFGKTHSLIAGAYRNGNLDTVDLLYKYGERPEAHEMDEIGFIPGYAILIIRTDGKRQYVPFASKENAYIIYHSLQNVAVDTTENIKVLAVQCDNVIMEKSTFRKIFEKFQKKCLTIGKTYVILCIVNKLLQHKRRLHYEHIKSVRQKEQ